MDVVDGGEKKSAEWPFNGPRPDNFEIAIKKRVAIEGEKNRIKIEAEETWKAYRTAAETLINLAQTTPVTNVKEGIPEMTEDQTLEEYLNSLTPVEQKIQLNQAVMNRAGLVHDDSLVKLTS